MAEMSDSLWEICCVFCGVARIPMPEARCGPRLLWKFNTVIGQRAGVQALSLGSGGAWETPLVGSDGSVTFGIGNPCSWLLTRSPECHPCFTSYGAPQCGWAVQELSSELD